MKLTPLNDQVLIKDVPFAAEDNYKKGSSGIISVGDTEAFESTFKGEVIAIGQQVTSVKEGDTVLYRQAMFDPIAIEKEKYYIGRENALVGLYA